MKTKFRFLTKLLLLLWISCMLATVIDRGHDQRAKQIIDATGVKGGLIVHIGCGNGKLTATLHGGGSYLIHGLDSNAQAVEAAREHIRKLGIYEPVSVEEFDGKRLPYAENLVNLVVVEDLGARLRWHGRCQWPTVPVTGKWSGTLYGRTVAANARLLMVAWLHPILSKLIISVMRCA